MPKIVIREVDKTTGNGAAYANFAVVVPGFVKAATAATAEAPAFQPNLDVFDDNGIYECTTQEDFKKNVGLTSSINHKVADAKKPTWTDEAGWAAPKALSAADFAVHAATKKLYYITPNTTGNIGRCQDETYEYHSVSTEDAGTLIFTDTPGATADTYTKFMLLKDIGHNELREDHYGNQIAYELLGLGYTVLYKKIDSTTNYLEQEAFWKPLKDKTLYDFRYIMSGLVEGNLEVYRQMVRIAEFTPENEEFDDIGPTTHGRGDCIALLDIDEATYVGKPQEEAIEAILEFAEANIPTSKYAAVFAPSVKYAKGGLSEVSSFGDNQWFPASFHYLACAARSSEQYNEWYANAGYSRGISKYTIEAVSGKFGEAAVNMFQRRSKDAAKNITMAINPIINLRGTYYLWGNRTTQPLGDASTDDGDLKASHFLNIRQLCCSIKKKVYVACRQVTFDPNSELLWTKFCNSIEPLLNKMKADQGIADYKIIKVKNNRKAFLSVVIRIVPIEAVEDFDISIHLEDSLDGLIATTEE